MFNIPFLFTSDSYKYSHWSMLLPGTQKVHSYFESRIGSQFDGTLFYGLQPILQEYFSRPITKHQINDAEELTNIHFGAKYFNRAGWEYILKQHKGFLPLEIRAVAEGTYVPTSNALLTCENTDDNTPWLTNFAETVLTHVWYPTTVATLSYNIKRILRTYLEKTCDDNTDYINNILSFMLHDFGCRGTENMFASALGGSAHLLNFNGTDTIPSLIIPNNYYLEDKTFVPGYSIAASEHSIMTARGKDGEMGVVRHLLNTYPEGILSIVIDSYDYKNFLEQMVALDGDIRKIIESRKGKVVFRPDSGNPVEVAEECLNILSKLSYTVNQKGFKVLPSNVGLIWGDGIDIEGIKSILNKTIELGWSAENWVFGMGGGLLQKVNRDTCRFAFKCSAQKYEDQWHDVQKNPLDKSKASKPGRLELVNHSEFGWTTRKIGSIDDGLENMLKPVYRNGMLLNQNTFSNIIGRARS